MTMESTLRLRPKPLPQRPLARWLWENRWTVTQLAEAIGVDKATISRAANSGKVGYEMADRIKKATGLKAL